MSTLLWVALAAALIALFAWILRRASEDRDAIVPPPAAAGGAGPPEAKPGLVVSDDVEDDEDDEGDEGDVAAGEIAITSDGLVFVACGRSISKKGTTPPVAVAGGEPNSEIGKLL